MSQNLTRDQLRSQHAFKSVKGVLGIVKKQIDDAGSDEKRQGKAKKYPQEYLSYANSLPANIVMNGLGQACAMLLAQAKGKQANEDAHRLLYDHLHGWLCQGEHAVYANQACLVQAVIGSGQRQYIRAQVEALAYLEWLKKFAQAYLSEVEAQDGKTE
mgnify:CR=1 FL=1